MWTGLPTRPALAALALLSFPATAVADRGALTLEVGPALTLAGVSPSEGEGSTALARGGGASLGVRYALSNAFELAVTALWEAPADYFHTGVTMGSPSGSVRGTLSERVQRLGALGGVHYVRGYVWRLHLGAEFGWMREAFSRRDLLDVNDPANMHSFGLGLQDRTVDSLVLAPVAGVEWQLTDHWSVSVLPRLEFLLGGSSRVGLLVPVSVGYSWYLF